MINPFHNYELKLKLKGIASFNISSGQVFIQSYIVQDKIMMTGAEYFRQGNDSDTISFKIKHNGQVVSTPADDLYLSHYGRYEFYKAQLFPGMEIEVTYKNNGANDATFRYNIIAHMET